MTRSISEALRRGLRGGLRAYLVMAILWLCFAGCDKAGFNVGLWLGVSRGIGSLLIALGIAGPLAFLIGGSVAFVGGLWRWTNQSPLPPAMPSDPNRVSEPGSGLE